jgi:hypothetical protein
VSQTIEIKESLAAGWRMTKSRYPLILAYAGTFLAIGAVRFFLDKAIDAVAVKVILGLGFQVLNWYMTFNALGISIKIVDDKETGYADLWTPQGPFWFYVLATILYGLITAGGVLLLVVPGVIWGLMFMFYGYTQIEHNLGPIQGLESQQGVNRRSERGVVPFFVGQHRHQFAGVVGGGVGIVCDHADHLLRHRPRLSSTDQSRFGLGLGV